MALTIKHAYQSATADDPTREVSSSEWNAAMTVTGTLDAANGGTGTATGISAATQTALDGKVNDTGDTIAGSLTITGDLTLGTSTLLMREGEQPVDVVAQLIARIEALEAAVTQLQAR